MTDLDLDTQVKLKKDLPDLEASQAPLGKVVADDATDRKFITIQNDDKTRDGWFFYLDEVKNFDDWFEVIK
jgi:hypothetical protein